MYKSYIERANEILHSKMNDKDIIDNLEMLRKSMKQNLAKELKGTGEVLIPSSLILGILYKMDHTVIDALMGKYTGIISDANAIMFASEAITGEAAAFYMILLIGLLENYIVDNMKINSYQKRLKVHR